MFKQKIDDKTDKKILKEALDRREKAEQMLEDVRRKYRDLISHAAGKIDAVRSKHGFPEGAELQENDGKFHFQFEFEQNGDSK